MTLPATGNLPAASSSDVSSALTASFNPSNLTPGQSVPYSVVLDTSKLTNPGTVKGATETIQTTPSGCQASWFTVTRNPAVTYPATFQPNSGSPTVDQGSVAFTDSGTDQSACAGGSVKLTVTLTP